MENTSLNNSQFSISSNDSKKINSKSYQQSLLQENDEIRDRNDRRRSRHQSFSAVSAPLAVSHEQLKDIYATCIKLSAENKITKQNAFGLQLIDYMQEVLQQIREENGTNFQVASCTLDAGVKIFGHRVDSVHLDAFRIAGSLGYGSESHEDQKPIENVDQLEEVKDTKTKKSKNNEKHAQSKIETNLKNIELDKTDLDEGFNLWDVVYARKPISASFGQGGPDAFIFNTYHISSDTGKIVIDPLEKSFDLEDQIQTDSISSFPSIVTEIAKISEVETINLLGSIDIFSFKIWNQPTHTKNFYKNIIPVLLKNNEMDEDDDQVSSKSSVSSLFNDVQEPSFIEDQAETYEDPPRLQFSNVQNNDLINALAPQPTEYSYFTDIKPFNLVELGTNIFNNDFLTKIKNNYVHKKANRKIKKQVDEDDFFDEFTVDEKKRLSIKGRRNFQVFKNENYNLTTDELVENFESNYLFLLFINNRACLCTDPNEKSEIIHSESPNFGPNSEVEESSDNVDYEPDIQAEPNDIDISLLPQPPVLDRVMVKYAKFAKRINTKVVKSSIWKYIDREELKGLCLILNLETDDNRSKFSEIHKHLIKVLPKSTSSNLSPQLSFVCLLHLANEKNLELLSDTYENYSDIIIKR